MNLEYTEDYKDKREEVLGVVSGLLDKGFTMDQIRTSLINEGVIFDPSANKAPDKDLSLGGLTGSFGFGALGGIVGEYGRIAGAGMTSAQSPVSGPVVAGVNYMTYPMTGELSANSPAYPGTVLSHFSDRVRKYADEQQEKLSEGLSETKIPVNSPLLMSTPLISPKQISDAAFFMGELSDVLIPFSLLKKGVSTVRGALKFSDTMKDAVRIGFVRGLDSVEPATRKALTEAAIKRNAEIFKATKAAKALKDEEAVRVIGEIDEAIKSPETKRLISSREAQRIDTIMAERKQIGDTRRAMTRLGVEERNIQRASPLEATLPESLRSRIPGGSDDAFREGLRGIEGEYGGQLRDSFAKEFAGGPRGVRPTAQDVVTKIVEPKAAELDDTIKAIDSMVMQDRKAIENAYKEALKNAVGKSASGNLSASEAEFVGDVIQKLAATPGDAEEIISSATKAAETDENLSEFMNAIKYWTFDIMKGGKAAQISEGKLRMAARVFKDKEVRRFILEDIPDMLAKSRGVEKEVMFRAEQIRRNVSIEVNRVAKHLDDTSVSDLGESIRSAFVGGDIRSIPDDDLRGAVQEASEFISALSQRFIDEGVLKSSKTAETFRKNMGKYLHTYYAAHQGKGWYQTVRNTSKWDAALKYLQEKFPNLSSAEIQGYMYTMIEKGSGGSVKGLSSELPSQIFDILKRKKNIPTEIQDLLGMDRDFTANFMKSASMMINDLQATSFRRELLDKALKNGVIHKGELVDGIVTSPGEGFVKITLDKLDPNTPYFTDKEFALALNLIDRSQSQRQTISFLAFANGLTKFGKIVPSMQTQGRNFVSLVPMLMQSGAMGVMESIKDLSRVRSLDDLFKISIAEDTKLVAKLIKNNVFRGKRLRYTPEQANIIAEAHRYDLLGNGAFSGEQEAWLHQMYGITKGEGLFARGAREISRKTPGIRAISNKAVNFMRRAYQTTDDAGKLYAWRVHSRRYKSLIKTNADKAMVMEKLGTVDPVAAAAEYTKETMQHFARVAPVAKKLSRNVVGGVFVSFPLEMARNAKNVLLHGGYEIAHGMKHGRMDWVASGVAKYAGLAATVQGFKAYAKERHTRLGITDRMMEAFRRQNLFEWNKNSDIIITKREGNEITYFDAGYSNPQGALAEIITGISRPGPLKDRFFRMAKELESVFLGREIALNTAIELITNTRSSGGIISGALSDSGRRVFNPEDPEKLATIATYIFDSLGPGGAVQLDNLMKSLGSKRAIFGLGEKVSELERKHRIPWHEMLAMATGPRIVTIDTEKMFQAKMLEIARKERNVSSSRRGDWAEAVDRVGRQDVLDSYEGAYAEIQGLYSQAIQDARSLGLSDRKIIDLVKEKSILSRKRLGYAASGNTVPQRVWSSPDITIPYPEQ